MREYELIRSRRKTLALEITTDCRLLARAPLRMPRESVEAFILQKEDWIARTMEKQSRSAPSLSYTEAEIAALRAQARAVLPEKVAYWSRVTGLVPTGIKITSARRRYGSCSGKNSLCFSCFLMTLPEDAIDLVVVHELCHIQEKNHGPRFYALLEQFLPDYRQRQQPLRPRS